MKHEARILLIEARKQHQWSQQEVADHLGTTSHNVSRWELGQTTPGPYFRAKISALFGTSVEELGLVNGPITGEHSSLCTSDPMTGLSPAQHQGTVWHLPLPRNALFTGREELLRRVHAHFNQERVSALSQPLALSGLGGIGKTQTALEYAYRYAQQYQAILWVSAQTRETLFADFVAIALALLQGEPYVPERMVDAVKQWLQQQKDWLLVFDNVEDLGIILPFLPAGLGGHILLTTRLQATGTLAHCLDLERMAPEDGALFLLRRAKLLSARVQEHEGPASLQTQARDLCETLDGLPLALDQVGAFIEETGCSLAAYRALYEQQATALHAWQSQSTPGYPHAVSTTFALSLQRVEHTLPLAADLLRLCAFLHPDAIPESLLSAAAAHPASLLAPLAAEQLRLHQALAVLMQQSLLKRHPEARDLAMHRLVQTVLKEQLDRASYQYWVNQAIEAVNQSFPAVEELTTWPQCHRMLPHALICVQLIEDEAIESLSAGRLLQQTGIYLLEQARYAQAERCTRRALHIRIQMLGEKHPQVAESLSTLAELRYFLGAYEQAKALHQQALCLRMQQLGPAHPDVATSLNNLAGVLCMQEEYEAAEPLYAQALRFREQLYGAWHLDVAESLQNLGYLYMQQGRYTLAETLYQRCLSLCERLLEPDHGYLATILNNIGTLSLRQGRLMQAQAYYQQALLICQQQFSGEHPRLALTYANLAELADAQGAYRWAEAWHQRALQIREKTLGSQHPRTIESRQRLAKLSQGQQGKERMSEQRDESALPTREQVQEPEYGNRVGMPSDVAVLPAMPDNAQKVPSLCQRASSIRERARTNEGGTRCAQNTKPAAW